ncbi:MAG: glycine cleavage system aminomethyltransferase GcvT [Haloarculaceae archaeon]
MALRMPPLREVHADRGATFTEFGGWDMPVEFDSIRTEHEAVRNAAGVFDVSHMGQIEVSGPDAATLLDRLTTNDVSALDPGEAQYAAVTDEAGVMLDDTVVYRLPEGGDADYLFVPNAGHDAEMYDRWTGYRDEHGLDATVENVTDAMAMFAVQGPDAAEHVAGATDAAVRDLPFFETTYGTVAGVETLFSRSGYTGEDGFELLCPAGDAEAVYGSFEGVQPCGLGARDTLRLEMGFLLSGQDFHPEEDPRNPFEADVGFAVDLDTEFVGRDALARVAEAGVEERLTGFRLTERGVPRHGYDIVDTDGRIVGTVTSGTMSPTLGEPIGMGYLPVEFADPGTALRVVVRGEQKSARVQSLPFIQ